MPTLDVPPASPDVLILAPGLWARISPGVMTFHGDIDLLTERAFRCAVTTQANRQGGQLVVDLTELNFLDSGGIGALYAMANDPELALGVRVHDGSLVDRVLIYSGMDRILRIERVAAAVA